MRSLFTAPLASAVLLLACCSSSSVPSATQPTDPGDGGEIDSGADAAPVEDSCGPIAKSKCKPKNEASVIRGIVHFDPAHFVGRKAPKLRIFLNHGVTDSANEAKYGGHPHADTTAEHIDPATGKATDVVDVASGKASFTLDLCEYGVAMYSEENCGFNLIAILDEDGDNDPSLGAASREFEVGELTKMVRLDVSCHKPSPCLDITLDCTGGTDCTTFEPVSMANCKCAAEKCPSDDKICN